jgi:hypothetical protein
VESDSPIVEKVLQILPALAKFVLPGLSVGDILKTIDCPEDDILLVEQWGYVDQHGTPAAVRPLDDDFQSLRRLSTSQDLRHRRAGVREWAPIQVVETKGPAVALVSFAQARGAPPQLGGALVVAKNDTIG